jgi:vacuolar-type H+-ATPase subunit H
LQDAASRNALSRFEASLKKKYPELLESFDEEALRDTDEVRELCEMIEAV